MSCDFCNLNKTGSLSLDNDRNIRSKQVGFKRLIFNYFKNGVPAVFCFNILIKNNLSVFITELFALLSIDSS